MLERRIPPTLGSDGHGKRAGPSACFELQTTDAARACEKQRRRWRFVRRQERAAIGPQSSVDQRERFTTRHIDAQTCPVRRLVFDGNERSTRQSQQARVDGDGGAIAGIRERGLVEYLCRLKRPAWSEPRNLGTP